MNVSSKVELENEIVEFILKHDHELSDIACVKRFVDEYSRLASQITEKNKYCKRLVKAKEQFIPFEKQVQICNDTLGASEKELYQLARPLGQAAFDAFLAGDVKQGRILSGRLDVHKRIKSLKKQRASHIPQQDSGITQKAKLKAQQLAITGKIKLEEAKIHRLEEEIGRQLIQENLDDSVRCDSTIEMLNEITFLRDNIIKHRQDLQKANAAQQKAINQLCKAIPLELIESSKTLDDEIKVCNKSVQDLESSLEESNQLMINSLYDVDQNKLPEPLLTLLGQLKDSPKETSEYLGMAGKEFQEATIDLKRGATGIGRSAKHWWDGLSKRGKYIAIGVFGLLLLVAMFSEKGPGNNSSLSPSEVDKEFKIAASQKGMLGTTKAEMLIDFRNNENYSWDGLDGIVNFQMQDIKDEYEMWKQGRIDAGDRFK